MSEPWRTQQRERAQVSLERFIQAHAGCAVDRVQPQSRGGTNTITFGTFHGQPVVFKYFDMRQRKEHEQRVLRLLAPTGLVPRVYAVEADRMIVMERLRGQPLWAAEKHLNQEQTQGVYYQLGQALARIAQATPAWSSAPLASGTMDTDFYQFYWNTDLATFWDAVMERAARIMAEQEVPEREILSRSHSVLQGIRDAILSYPSFVHMDDLHTNNMMVDGSQFVGFIDLEMTRLGNEVLLIAAALVALADRDSLWRSVLGGYEDQQARPVDDGTLRLARVAAPFSQWVRFVWWWTNDPHPEALRGVSRLWPIRDIKAITQRLGGMG